MKEGIKMKKMFYVVMCVVLIAGLSGVALARDTMQLDRRVQVRVEPTVTIIELAPLDTPVIQPGHQDAVITVGWMVDSNSQMMDLAAAASDLFKGDIPTSPYFLVKKNGVKITCPVGTPDYGAMPIGGVDVATYTGGAVTISGFQALQTNAIRFESNQSNRFSMPCYLTFTWNTTNAELPTGYYSGYVRFIATVVPPIS